MNGGGRIYTPNQHLPNRRCHSPGLGAILPKNQRAHEAKNQSQHSDRVRQHVNFFGRQSQTGFIAFQALKDLLRAHGGHRSLEYPRQRGVDNGTGDKYLEKIPGFPEALDFPKDKLNELRFQVRGRLQLVSQVYDLFSEMVLDQSRKQSCLSLEVTMNKAFCASRGSGDFPGCGRLVSLGGKEYQSSLDQSFLLRGAIPRSFGFVIASVGAEFRRCGGPSPRQMADGIHELKLRYEAASDGIYRFVGKCQESLDPFCKKDCQ